MSGTDPGNMQPTSVGKPNQNRGPELSVPAAPVQPPVAGFGPPPPLPGAPPPPVPGSGGLRPQMPMPPPPPVGSIHPPSAGWSPAPPAGFQPYGPASTGPPPQPGSWQGPPGPPRMPPRPMGPPPPPGAQAGGFRPPGPAGMPPPPSQPPPGGPPAPPVAQMQAMGFNAPQQPLPPPPLQPSVPANAPLRGGGVPPPMAPPSSSAASAPSFGRPPMPQQPGVPGQHFGPPAAPKFGPPPMPDAPAKQQEATSATSPSSSRINPEQIPRPVSGKGSREPIVYTTWRQWEHKPPPSSTTSFVVKDTGNCSPRYMRASLNQCPCTAEVLSISCMPFALVVQPLALPRPDEEPLRVVDFGQDGPVRCSHCKAYMNPHMRWVEGGRRFQCNFCDKLTDCPANYFAHVDGDGRRRDADERPELCRGSVEFVATKDYMVRPPMAITHVFLIDVSAYAMETGATASACAAVASILDSFQGGDTTRVGIATFGSHINFFSFKPGHPQPTMVVVPDSDEPFCPTPGTVAVSLSSFREEIRSLLENIPEMCQGVPSSENVGGAALRGAMDVLRECGGKITAFFASMPNTGALALKARTQGQGSGERDPQKMLESNDRAWLQFGQRCADLQIAIDVFLLTRNYIDIATVSEAVNVTGGTLYHYEQFTPELDQGQLENDLRWNLLRPQGMEAVMRVRCSHGISVEEYSGAIYQRTLTDVDLPSVDSDKAILVKLKHDEKLPDTRLAYFQAALLYTNTSGQRRIRVHTLAIPCTDVIGTLYRGADLDAQLVHLVRGVAQTLPGGTLANVREAATKTCVNVLHAYRKFCATSTSSGQLILPDALKLLPLYTLALLKSGALRGDMNVDGRAAWLQRLRTFGPSGLMPLVYPRLYNVAEAAQEGGDDLIPEAISLSSEKLEPKGIFLLENGMDAYMYIGKRVERGVLRDILGFEQLEEAGSGPISLPRLDTALSKTTNAVLDEIRRQRCKFMRLRIIKRNDGLETAFFNLLLEDRSVIGMSYVEFLCHIHRQIQNKLA